MFNFKCGFCKRSFKRHTRTFVSSGVFCSKSCSNKSRVFYRTDRFFSFVEKTKGCWNWVGCKSTFGHGKFIGTTAHRFSYEIHKCKIPKNMFVIHKCDNPSCVNPKHLFTGTAKQNSLDMVTRKRSCAGDKHWNCKLKYDDRLFIREIYSFGFTQYEIASIFGVTQTTIWNILNRIF